MGLCLAKALLRNLLSMRSSINHWFLLSCFESIHKLSYPSSTFYTKNDISKNPSNHSNSLIFIPSMFYPSSKWKEHLSPLLQSPLSSLECGQRRCVLRRGRETALRRPSSTNHWCLLSCSVSIHTNCRIHHPPSIQKPASPESKHPTLLVQVKLDGMYLPSLFNF